MGQCSHPWYDEGKQDRNSIEEQQKNDRKDGGERNG